MARHLTFLVAISIFLAANAAPSKQQPKCLTPQPAIRKLLDQCVQFKEKPDIPKELNDQTRKQLLCSVFLESYGAVCEKELQLTDADFARANVSVMCANRDVLLRNSEEAKKLVSDEVLCDHVCSDFGRGAILLCSAAFLFNNMTPVAVGREGLVKLPNYESPPGAAQQVNGVAQNQAKPVETEQVPEVNSQGNVDLKNGHQSEHTQDVGHKPHEQHEVQDENNEAQDLKEVVKSKTTGAHSSKEEKAVVKGNISNKAAGKTNEVENPQDAKKDPVAFIKQDVKAGVAAQSPNTAAPAKPTGKQQAEAAVPDKQKSDNPSEGEEIPKDKDTADNEAVQQSDAKENTEDDREEEMQENVDNMEAPGIAGDAGVSADDQGENKFNKPDADDQDSNIHQKPDKTYSSAVSAPTNVDGDSYFFSYFMMLCIIIVLFYVGYHNKQKIRAIVLEGPRGRRQHRSRRPNSANYHKLDSNLEEAITSTTVNKNFSHVIY